MKSNHNFMDREQLKLRLLMMTIRISELESTIIVFDALKAEIYSDVDAYKNSPAFKSISDYDELHDDDDDLL